MENFSKIASKYIVVLVPFKEKLTIDEHINKFEESNLPLTLGNFTLIYADSVDGSKIPETFYPDQQIFLIYSCLTSNQKLSKLADITTASNKSFLDSHILKTEFLSFQEKVSAEKNDLLESLKKSNETNALLSEENSKQALELQSLTDANTILNTKISELTKTNQENIKYIEQLRTENSNCIKQLKNLQEQFSELTHKEKDISLIEQENILLKERINTTLNTLEQKDLIIQQALQKCNRMIQSKLFKVTHLMNRTLNQGIRGNREERKNFRKWVLHHRKTGGDRDRRYNPLWPLIDILTSTVEIKSEAISSEVPIVELPNESLIKNNYITNTSEPILLTPYTKYDVIILGVIDYDFRFQRPQHFASRYAANGHRVFYINANHFNPTSVEQIQENLYVVNFNNKDYTAIHLTDWKNQENELRGLLKDLIETYCICDSITIVDYPNWIRAALYLREYYGFKIVTDYMDDYTGFLNPAEKLVGENCKLLLQQSDTIIPSSQFLYDIAKNYNPKISIVRNGTEFEHFHQAYTEIIKKEKQIIGYYGAIAEWFDVNKVCYVAEHMPETEIILIGHVTAGEKKLQKYSNIKLLGEKSYSELPNYLKDFDVCLIPFDTSTDLIKATNPVKFYEYLSAGKKIVSTEIPELMPFKDKYVYMSNDNKTFLQYIQICLNSTDTLASAEECSSFAQKNDWQERFVHFSELARQNIPQIDIIVLTYNNLKLNKLCIDSILQKTAYPNYRLIIVDNLSTDGTREYLQQLQEKNIDNIKIILNEENLGFAAGNNVGLKASTGDYVVLLNNDTIVTRGWLTALSKHLENNPKLGMCGPVTNSIGNEAKIDVDYSNTKELELFAYSYTHTHLQEEYSNIKVLAFFCTMIKREVLNLCGLLDESYGLGMFEDDDYAEAVKKSGYQLSVAEDAFIHHFQGASFKKLQDEKFQKLFQQNKEIFENKWKTTWKAHNYRPNVSWETHSDIDIL